MNNPIKLINHGLLTIISNLEAYLYQNNDILLTKKFIEGISAYTSRWNGPVRLLLQQARQPTDNLDNLRISPSDLDAEVIVTDFSSPEIESHIYGSNIVLVAAGYRQNLISNICNHLSIPSVYVTEYSLKARLQSLFQNETNPFRMIRSIIWNLNQERKQRHAIASAQGLQANGTPTYKAYQKISPNPLLYFDNRINNNDPISQNKLNVRTTYLSQGMPLRLAFSGRLIQMKGAAHLIPLCQELDKLNFPYTMTIFGGGDLAEKMNKHIIKNRMNDHVYMTGTIDFRSELLPTLKKSIDLFVCCHLQGDPSCTYIETFACGLPIAGYSNEAFLGLLNHTPDQLGVSVVCGDIQGLAKEIQQLNQNRQQLITMSHNALTFATKHSFEKTFDKRIEHLASLAQST